MFILAANNLNLEVRPATVDDIPLLLSFIHSMAAFEKLAVSATEESLQDALFGAEPAGRALLVFLDGQPVAYVTYFFTFATMVGKRGLWLDDLYIDPAYRGRGIGQALMAYLAEIALRNRCGRFEWMVLDWNEAAIAFYRRLGAELLHDWRICRLDEGQLPALADRLSVHPG
jgi:GNAT superfamily N-acetyltransferase